MTCLLSFSILGSNHYGIAGYYAMQALKENMIVSEKLTQNCLFLHQFVLFCSNRNRCPF